MDTSMFRFMYSSQRPSPSKMAPTTTIETITITRPLKVIAFICGVIVVILMIMALASTDWLMAAGWRQGLFIHCIEEDVESPLPFNLHDPPGCYASRDVAYIKATATLCIITLVTDIIATILTGLGLRTQNHNVKYKFYRIAVLVMLLSLLAVLSALIIYPVCFAGELNLANRPIWEFGWAYGVGWGAAIFYSVPLCYCCVIRNRKKFIIRREKLYMKTKCAPRPGRTTCLTSFFRCLSKLHVFY
ncbi:unnamed protein product [Ceratitis capitata]|uniref:(Mediterranean fruit fly) hypothetical protein n=1 Tax=Ceratitis capitata TaxID=7213 RepID=A0A811U1B3_CERCA|nr:unnamed protein product [Ceratitis capitata]